MKKYLITYGDENYVSQLEFFKETAIASSFFDELRIFGPKDIGPEFADQVGETLQVSKGGGFWLWKPYFIKRMLDELKDDDILVYCDAGCIINGRGKERFDEYISLLISAETGTLDFDVGLKEYEYTKQEIFDHFDSSESLINSNQLIATVLIFRKCTPAIKLVEEWVQTACNHPLLFTDELVMNHQYEGFIDARHDQSVFSVIRKTRGANIIPDETYFLDFIRDGSRFPFWATRLKG